MLTSESKQQKIEPGETLERERLFILLNFQSTIQKICPAASCAFSYKVINLKSAENGSNVCNNLEPNEVKQKPHLTQEQRKLDFIAQLKCISRRRTAS
jgi:hypothetical protein